MDLTDDISLTVTYTTHTHTATKSRFNVVNSFESFLTLSPSLHSVAQLHSLSYFVNVVISLCVSLCIFKKML